MKTSLHFRLRFGRGWRWRDARQHVKEMIGTTVGLVGRAMWTLTLKLLSGFDVHAAVDPTHPAEAEALGATLVDLTR